MSYSPYQAPASSASDTPETVFAPLPLRTRGVLENVDVAFKLFKQYWKPLLAWAATTNVLMLFANYFGLLLAPPLMIGTACCVLAAAVRGQDVDFKQCWNFSQKRIGGLLALHIASMLALIVIVGALGLGLVMLAAQVGPDLSSSLAASFILIALGVLVVGWVLSLLMAWQGMISMVACMEDEFRNAKAFKRAWILLRGRWKAAVGLVTVLNLALAVLYGVLWGVFGLFMGFNDISRAIQGGGDGLMAFGALGAVTVSSWLLFTLSMPITYLSQALFYLDARVRNEALDLEWNAHRTVEGAPHAPAQVATGVVDIVPQNFFERIETPQAASVSAPLAPQTTSTWESNPAQPEPISLQKPPADSEDTAGDDGFSRFSPR